MKVYLVTEEELEEFTADSYSLNEFGSDEVGRRIAKIKERYFGDRDVSLIPYRGFEDFWDTVDRKISERFNEVQG